MTVNFSHQQMLQTWRRRAGLESSAIGCSIERFDGVDVDSRLSDMMRQWYLDLLDRGDPGLAGEAADVSELISAAADGNGYEARLICGETVRRLQSVRLTGWERPATVAESRDIRRTLALQSNPYSRAGNADPIAWRDEGGHIHAIPASEGSSVAEAKGYVDTGKDCYRIDERALSTIPAEIAIF